MSVLAFVVSPGCGTSAKGIQDCRDIEQARCDAAAACGIVSSAAECRLYYRDHCLHGLPVTPPQPAEIDDCVATITSLGTCVQSNGRDATLDSCNLASAADNAALACEVVQYPERAYACSFLTGTEATPPTPTAGQGGQAGGG